MNLIPAVLPPVRCSQALQKICWYVALSPAYSTDRGSASDHATLLGSTLADKKLEDLPRCGRRPRHSSLSYVEPANGSDCLL